MLSKRLIACLDIKDGRIVKGVNFISLRDAGDPIEAAGYYASEGIDELCFLDISASVEKRKIVQKLVSQVADQIFIPFTVGGGLSSLEDMESILHAGADKISVNTAAFHKPQLLENAAKRFGSQCIVCAIDVRRKAQKGKEDFFEVYLHGGRTATGKDALSWAKAAAEHGAGEILLTSMDRDGTREGYDIELIQQVRAKVHVPVIASGGAGKLEHIIEALERAKADAVLAASIFHFSEYSIRQIKEAIAQRSIAVRL